jgi:phage-related protein
VADQLRRKPVRWITTSRGDLRRFPKEVRIGIGVALNEAQLGGKHPAARPMKGFHGAGVVEVVEDFDGNTYRAVYTVRFAEIVYVLHAFQRNQRNESQHQRPILN